MFALCVVAAVGDIALVALSLIRGEEGTAAHAGINITLQLLHLFGGDIIRNHPLGRTFCRQFRKTPVFRILVDIIFIQNVNQFRERRGDPDAFFVFDALHSLDQNLADNGGQIFSGLSFRNLIQVHEHGDKRRLPVAGHQRDQLVLDGLDAASYFLCQPPFCYLGDDCGIHALSAGFSLFLHQLTDFFTADVHKRSQVRQREGLSSVLVGGDLGYNLCRYVAGGEEAVRLFNQGFADYRSVLQHILQVDQVTVVLLLGKIIGIMEMDDACLVGADNFFRKENTAGQILADLAGHVITLGGIDDGVLVGVFLLYFLVHLVDQSQDAVIGGV